MTLGQILHFSSYVLFSQSFREITSAQVFKRITRHANFHTVLSFSRQIKIYRVRSIPLLESCYANNNQKYASRLQIGVGRFSGLMQMSFSIRLSVLIHPSTADGTVTWGIRRTAILTTNKARKNRYPPAALFFSLSFPKSNP